jgi:hypothetical protein
MTTPRIRNIWSKTPDEPKKEENTPVIAKTAEKRDEPGSISFSPSTSKVTEPSLAASLAAISPSTSAASIAPAPETADFKPVKAKEKLTGREDDYGRDNRRRRMSTKKRRTVAVSVCLSEEEERLLRAYMRKYNKGIAFSNWARRVMFQAAGIPIPDRTGDPDE